MIAIAPLRTGQRRGGVEAVVRERTALVCKLRVEAEAGEPERVFVLGDRSVVLGRAPESDIVINRESISRAHARFRRDGDSWIVSDLESKNGVRVNTFRVSEQHLRDGDRIDLGSTRLQVEIGPASHAARPANVVFEEGAAKPLHTEIFEMAGLSSLLGPSDASAARDDTESGGSRVSESPGRAADAGALEEVASLMRVVSDAAEALISCDSLDETLERILKLVFDNLPAERGVICLWDEKCKRHEPRVTRTREGVPDQPIRISSNIANHVIERKQALLVKNTRMDDRFGSAESVIMMDIHAAMCAPLYHDGRVSGFIYVDRRGSRERFETQHLHALSALAMLSAVAVERAALRDSVRHEQELRSRLARYSSPAVVERILRASGAAERGMVAEEGDVTVLFADLSGFTSMAESLHSGDVIQVLNQVFERLTRSVFELDGTLDKFRGDGMMAFFGAPLPMSDHAERAVEAALRMQTALAELSGRSSNPHPLSMRIGINSGAVVVGDIGTPQRKDYTVIGDTVNIASRLESAVARPGEIVIGFETWRRVHTRFHCEPLEPVQVKGKTKAVQPYRVLGRLE